MQEYPRRTLLGGIGLTITSALASHAVVADTDDEQDSTPDVPADGPDFTSLLEYLPASVSTETMTVTVTDYERMLEADQPHGPHPFVGPFELDLEGDDEVSKAVTVEARDDGFSSPIAVFEGTVDLDGEAEPTETDDGDEYELYEHEETRREETTYAAVADDVIVVAENEDTIDDAFAAKAGDTDRLLEEETRLADGIETYDHADSRHVIVEEEAGHMPVDAEDVRFVVHASTVLDPDTILVDLGVEFESEEAITDEVIEALETEFAYMPTQDEPEAEVEGTLVTITITRDLAAERAVREHDSPGRLRVNEREIDLEEDDYLEIELGRGDPTPVADLSFEVDDEEYDRDVWAGDAKKLEEGDTIRLDMDDVEPNLQLRLQHDHELGSSGSGTTILNHFTFRFEYDYDQEAVDVEYADEFPLDGEKLWLAVHDPDATDGPREPDQDEPEPRLSTQPWDGELSTGDEATLEDVHPGDDLIVGWDGDSRRDSVAQHRIRPPGAATFEYDYDEQTVTATLELEDERDAEKYELRVNDEPTETQWADESDTVTDGATLDATSVDVGSRVTVVWSETEDQVGWFHTDPPGAATFEYDYDEQTVTATLELEDERDAEKYELWVDREPTEAQWTDEYDTVTDGATLEVDDVDFGSEVSVVWNETEDQIGWYHVEPPGSATFEYDYDEQTVTATLELDGERSAEKYELLIDREPAETQWTDESDTVTDGATLEVDDVDIGTNLSVVWTETGDHIGGGRAEPSVDLELRVDDGEFEHVGGAELPSSKLTARLWADGERETIDLEAEVDGTFEEGDVVSVDLEDVREVLLEYDGSHRVGSAWERD